MSGSKHKSSSDVAGTAKKRQVITMEKKVKIIEREERGEKMELEVQRKDEERQEEEGVTKELKRFTTQEMARGFSLFEETLLVFKAQDLNVELYTKVAAAVQNAVQCYSIIYDEKKRSYYPDITGSFFQEGR